MKSTQEKEKKIDKLNKHIFLLCTRCKHMVIALRGKDDPKGSILMTTNTCDKCWTGEWEDVHYYNLKGEIDL